MASVSSRRGGKSSAIPSRSHSHNASRSTAQGSRGKLFTLRAKAAGFKPHPNPYGDQHGQQYTFKLLANGELVEAIGLDFMDEWMKVNPREQKLTGPIMKAIEDTWMGNPSEFFRVNRGLVISAESVKFDSENGTVEIVFADPKKHGIVDGGHTFKKIIKELIPATYGPPTEDDESDGEKEEAAERESLNGALGAIVDDEEPEEVVDRYVSCEVWVGLKLEQAALLTQGRNTSRTVPPYAIMSIKGEFDPLKKAIDRANPTYANKVVAFKPNEHVEGLDEFKPVSVLDVLQLLTAMDIGHYDANDHPVEAYKNKAFGAKYYGERNVEYVKMFPVVGDFLKLFDKLRQVVPEAYDEANSSPKRWTKVLAGEGQQVDKRQVEPLYYLDPTGQTMVFRSPNALFFPMFSAFRAHLKDVGGRYQWQNGKSPCEWDDADFHEACKRLALKIAKAVKNKEHVHNAVGRDPEVWATCYETLNSFLFEYGMKSRS